MAAICAVAGGMVGFGSALVSLLVFDASLLTALALWSGIGIGCMALCLALMLRRAAAMSPAPVTATSGAA